MQTVFTIAALSALTFLVGILAGFRLRRWYAARPRPLGCDELRRLTPLSAPTTRQVMLTEELSARLEALGRAAGELHTKSKQAMVLRLEWARCEDERREAQGLTGQVLLRALPMLDSPLARERASSRVFAPALESRARLEGLTHELAAWLEMHEPLVPEQLKTVARLCAAAATAVALVDATTGSAFRRAERAGARPEEHKTRACEGLAEHVEALEQLIRQFGQKARADAALSVPANGLTLTSSELVTL